MIHKKYRLFYYSVFLILVGIISLALENILYQSVDENGVLQESMFMPLGFILIFVGIFLIVIKFIYIVKK